jgi:hypothetical protein
MGSLLSPWRMHCGHEPALWHRLRGAGVFAAPPEVSAVAATSGYYLSTLRVEEHGSCKAFPDEITRFMESGHFGV